MNPYKRWGYIESLTIVVSATLIGSIGGLMFAMWLIWALGL